MIWNDNIPKQFEYNSTLYVKIFKWFFKKII